MAKNLEKLGSIDEFKAPWETDAGETEIVKPRLRTYIFGLLRDKAKAQDARDEALEQVSTVEAERDAAKVEAAKKHDPDSASKIADLEAKLSKAQSDLAEHDRLALAEQVAEEKGLTKAQSQYLSGKTEEELGKSADKFIKDNGITIPDPDSDPDNEAEPNEGTARRSPRSTLQNPGDIARETNSSGVVDYEALVAGFDQTPFR